MNLANRHPANETRSRGQASVPIAGYAGIMQALLVRIPAYIAVRPDMCPAVWVRERRLRCHPSCKYCRLTAFLPVACSGPGVECTVPSHICALFQHSYGCVSVRSIYFLIRSSARIAALSTQSSITKSSSVSVIAVNAWMTFS